MNRPIALLTDFGTKDHFVGSLKGVILGINPSAIIFDITHEVRPQNIWDGAFVLYSVYSYVPNGTIIVAVVDPGVGSERRAICVKTDKCFLLAPDNGLLNMVIRDEKKFEARKIVNDRYFRKPVSNTFHGRDIFAPTAAYLSERNIFQSLGPIVRDIHRLRIPEPQDTKTGMTGEVLYIDRFGNVMTNISKSFLGRTFNSKKIRILVKNKFHAQMKLLFCEGASGELIALWNSTGLLELAVKNDSAEKEFKLKVGDPVTVLMK